MARTDDSKGAYCYGKDIMWGADGGVYHLGIRSGDIFPRIVQVGLHSRAALFSSLLDESPPFKRWVSERQFHVYSGYYKGVGVTIIGTGMGTPIMDFMVREASYVCPGPMAIIRVGTCGLIDPKLEPGTVVVADESSYLNRNYGSWDGVVNTEVVGPRYVMTRPVPANVELTNHLYNALSKQQGVKSARGRNCAAETFYACQGRNDELFEDHNSFILPLLTEQGVSTMEMETHCLFHLAKCRKDQKLYAAACHLGVVNRTNSQMTENVAAQQLSRSTLAAGEAALQAVVAMKL